MTVSSSTNRVSYSGNGTLTVFAYTFKVFDESDLTVILRASDGTETVQTITTHYTVSGVGDVGGGNITFVTAPTATQTVVILREQPLTQGLDLVPNDPFPAESLEESFDKLTFMVQQHEEELGRAIKASRTNTITTTEFVESASDRANKVIAFDGSGDLDLTQEIGTFQGNWAASTAYAVRDIVKDTNNNNIYIANTAHTSSGTVPLTGNADIAKWDLLVDAAAATTSANNAATSATAAATSATAAATSATAAATSESNAATSASNASTSETNAAASATNAATSESNAAGSESAAATSETNAATSATSASTSASAAATSATNAATSETAAAASQSAAATSATAAATSATSAATNATNAATSATNASTAQTAAETAQTAAEAAQAAAELAADNFDDTYLGSKSSDPTVDNDGGALNAGDLYFNTTANELRVYSGSAWQAAALDASGYITTSGGSITGNLSVSGDLTVDTNTLYVDSTNNRVGVGTSSPARNVSIVDSSVPLLQLALSTDQAAGNGFELAYDGVAAYLAQRENLPMVFKTNDAERMRIDSSGNVIVGGTTAVNSNASTGNITINGSGNAILNFTVGGAAKGWFYHDGTNFEMYNNVSGANKFFTNGSERMRIDSNGRVAIGGTTVTDVNMLNIQGSGASSNIGVVLNDTNTSKVYGIQNGGSALKFFDYTASTERMRIDSSGNVGIGVAPSTKLHVKNGTNQNFNVFGPAVFSNGVTIASTADGFTGYLEMEQRATQFAWHNGTTERMRLTSGGRLLIARTTDNHGGVFCLNYTGGSTAGLVITDTSSSGTGVPMQIVNSGNSIVGSISHNQSSTSFNTSSDHRLKENVVELTGATDRLKQLEPKRFNFIADDTTTVDGFLAHEVQSVVPEAITGTHNEVDDDGNPVYQGIDQSKLVPLLVATIKELEARITALENA